MEKATVILEIPSDVRDPDDDDDFVQPKFREKRILNENPEDNDNQHQPKKRIKIVTIVKPRRKIRHICSTCNSEFSRKSALTVHKNANRCEKKVQKRNKCMYSGCETAFYHKSGLISHLKEKHNVQKLDVQKLSFSNWSEFQKWKDEEERQSLTCYTKHYGATSKHSYFYCQNDGPIDDHHLSKCKKKNEKQEKISNQQEVENEEQQKSSKQESTQAENENQEKSNIHQAQKNKKNKKQEKKGKQSTKEVKIRGKNRKGRIKKGFSCTSMIKAHFKKNGQVDVEYFPVHNHVVDPANLKHQPVSDAAVDFIKNQLALQVSPSKVFKSLRGDRFHRTNRKKIKLESLFRNDFIKLKSLRERKRKMNLSKCFSNDDSTSVDMLINSLRKEGEYDPILIYKPFGLPVAVGSEEAKKVIKEGFMLGLQTEEQMEMFQKCCNDILIIDATHKTNIYDFQLLNIMGVDEMRRGYPLGHLISKDMDGDTLQYFFQSIKLRCPPDVKINCIITDDDPALINAANLGFQSDIRHILCDWHFKRAVRKYLHSSLMQNPDQGLENEVFKEVCVIIGTKHETEFKKLCVAFDARHKVNKKLEKFLNHFRGLLKPSKAVKWAHCYRQFPHNNVNTTMFVESFHNQLKTIYLKRKVNKRVDHLIELLLEIEQDYYHNRLINQIVLGSKEIAVSEVSKRHDRAMLLSDSLLSVLEDDQWEVSSSSALDVKYVVTKNTSICPFPDNCFFRCTSMQCIGLCMHLYVCNCPDENPLCKHIHKVHASVIGITGTHEEINESPSCDGEPILYHNDTAKTKNGDDDPGADAEIHLKQQKKREETLLSLLSELSEAVKDEKVKELLFHKLRGTFTEALHQCNSVTKKEETFPLPALQPAMVVTSTQQLERQPRSFSELQRNKRKKRSLRLQWKAKEDEDIREGMLKDVDYSFDTEKIFDTIHNTNADGSIADQDKDFLQKSFDTESSAVKSPSFRTKSQKLVHLLTTPQNHVGNIFQSVSDANVHADAETLVKVESCQLLVQDDDFCISGFSQEPVLKEPVEKINGIAKLHPNMMSLIAKALNTANRADVSIVQSSNLTIHGIDFKTLKAGEKLNDQIINFYLQLLVERGKSHSYPKVTKFDTHFFNKLSESGFQSIQNWTKKEDIFSSDYILFPLNYPRHVHWSLVVVDVCNESLTHYDSFNIGTEPDFICLKVLFKYLNQESIRRRKIALDDTKWKKVFAQNIPKQSNKIDCGVFLCAFAEHICRRAPLQFTATDIPRIRLQMAYEILKKNLLN